MNKKTNLNNSNKNLKYCKESKEKNFKTISKNSENRKSSIDFVSIENEKKESNSNLNNCFNQYNLNNPLNMYKKGSVKIINNVPKTTTNKQSSNSLNNMQKEKVNNSFFNNKNILNNKKIINLNDNKNNYIINKTLSKLFNHSNTNLSNTDDLYRNNYKNNKVVDKRSSNFLNKISFTEALNNSNLKPNLLKSKYSNTSITKDTEISSNIVRLESEKNSYKNSNIKKSPSVNSIKSNTNKKENDKTNLFNNIKSDNNNNNSYIDNNLDKKSSKIKFNINYICKDNIINEKALSSYNYNEESIIPLVEKIIISGIDKSKVDNIINLNSISKNNEFSSNKLDLTNNKSFNRNIVNYLKQELNPIILKEENSVYFNNFYNDYYSILKKFNKDVSTKNISGFKVHKESDNYSNNILNMIFPNTLDELSSHSFPFIVENINNNNYYNIHNFCLFTTDSIRKYCSCLRVYKKFIIKSTNDYNIRFYALYSICMISNFPVNETMNYYLKHIADIFCAYNNTYTNTNRCLIINLKSNSLNIYNKNTNLINEIKILDFYFSFILNSLIHYNFYNDVIKNLTYSFMKIINYNINESKEFKCKKKTNDDSLFGIKLLNLCTFDSNNNLITDNTYKTICIPYIDNNSNQKLFIKYNVSVVSLVCLEHYLINLEKLKKNNSLNNFYLENIAKSISIKGNFNKFNINAFNLNTYSNFFFNEELDLVSLINYFDKSEKLIRMFYNILCENKIFIIYENISDINNIIYGLCSLIYPFKWELPIVSFITKENIDMIETPIASIIGVSIEFKDYLINSINKNSSEDELVVLYDLKDKQFINLNNVLDNFDLNNEINIYKSFVFSNLKNNLDNEVYSLINKENKFNKDLIIKNYIAYYNLLISRVKSVNLNDNFFNKFKLDASVFENIDFDNKQYFYLKIKSTFFKFNLIFFFLNNNRFVSSVNYKRIKTIKFENYVKINNNDKTISNNNNSKKNGYIKLKKIEFKDLFNIDIYNQPILPNKLNSNNSIKKIKNSSKNMAKVPLHNNAYKYSSNKIKKSCNTNTSSKNIEKLSINSRKSNCEISSNKSKKHSNTSINDFNIYNYGINNTLTNKNSKHLFTNSNINQDNYYNNLLKRLSSSTAFHQFTYEYGINDKVTPIFDCIKEDLISNNNNINNNVNINTTPDFKYLRNKNSSKKKILKNKSSKKLLLSKYDEETSNIYSLSYNSIYHMIDYISKGKSIKDINDLNIYIYSIVLDNIYSINNFKYYSLDSLIKEEFKSINHLKELINKEYSNFNNAISLLKLNKNIPAISKFKVNFDEKYTKDLEISNQSTLNVSNNEANVNTDCKNIKNNNFINKRLSNFSNLNRSLFKNNDFNDEDSKLDTNNHNSGIICNGELTILEKNNKSNNNISTNFKKSSTDNSCILISEKNKSFVSNKPNAYNLLMPKTNVIFQNNYKVGSKLKIYGYCNSFVSEEFTNNNLKKIKQLNYYKTNMYLFFSLLDSEILYNYVKNRIYKVYQIEESEIIKYKINLNEYLSILLYDIFNNTSLLSISNKNLFNSIRQLNESILNSSSSLTDYGEEIFDKNLVTNNDNPKLKIYLDTNEKEKNLDIKHNKDDEYTNIKPFNYNNYNSTNNNSKSTANIAKLNPINNKATKTDNYVKKNNLLLNFKSKSTNEDPNLYNNAKKNSINIKSNDISQIKDINNKNSLGISKIKNKRNFPNISKIPQTSSYSSFNEKEKVNTNSSQYVKLNVTKNCENLKVISEDKKLKFNTNITEIKSNIFMNNTTNNNTNTTTTNNNNNNNKNINNKSISNIIIRNTNNKSFNDEDNTNKINRKLKFDYTSINNLSFEKNNNLKESLVTNNNAYNNEKLIEKLIINKELIKKCSRNEKVVVSSKNNSSFINNYNIKNSNDKFNITSSNSNTISNNNFNNTNLNINNTISNNNLDLVSFAYSNNFSKNNDLSNLILDNKKSNHLNNNNSVNKKNYLSVNNSMVLNKSTNIKRYDKENLNINKDIPIDNYNTYQIKDNNFNNDINKQISFVSNNKSININNTNTSKDVVINNNININSEISNNIKSFNTNNNNILSDYISNNNKKKKISNKKLIQNTIINMLNDDCHCSFMDTSLVKQESRPSLNLKVNKHNIDNKNKKDNSLEIKNKNHSSIKSKNNHFSTNPFSLKEEDYNNIYNNDNDKYIQTKNVDENNLKRKCVSLVRDKVLDITNFKNISINNNNIESDNSKNNYIKIINNNNRYYNVSLDKKVNDNSIKISFNNDINAGKCIDSKTKHNYKNLNNIINKKSNNIICQDNVPYNILAPRIKLSSNEDKFHKNNSSSTKLNLNAKSKKKVSICNKKDNYIFNSTSIHLEKKSNIVNSFVLVNNTKVDNINMSNILYSSNKNTNNSTNNNILSNINSTVSKLDGDNEDITWDED